MKKMKNKQLNKLLSQIKSNNFQEKRKNIFFSFTF